MKVKIRISVIHLLISVGKFSVIAMSHREVRGWAQLQNNPVETGEDSINGSKTLQQDRRMDFSGLQACRH